MESPGMDHADLSIHDNLCHGFWRDLFYGKLPANRGAIRAKLERTGLPMDAGWIYCPALVVVRNWGQDLEDDHRLNRYGVNNVVVELFQMEAEKAGFWWTVFPFGQHGQMTICGGQDPQQLAECSHRFAQTYLKAERRYLDVSSACYLGQPVPIEQMPEEMEWLMRMDNTRLQNSGIAVHRPETAANRAGAELETKFDRWSGLLKGEQFEKAQREILDFLTAREDDPWFNKRQFRYFLSRYAGMLIGYSDWAQFPIGQLTADPESARCFETSDRGLDYMRKWVACSLGQIARANGGGDPISATKRYIEAHLAENLTLPQLAENVFLNPDYLTRIFKRETGVSVKTYIVNRRMEVAKKLLETTDIPIADVAYQVGYYNYTSFNRIFKKCYGISPQAFRLRDDND